MRHLLAILDRVPYPPGDGITYPVAGQLNGLASQYVIDLVVVSNRPVYGDTSRFRNVVHVPSPAIRRTGNAHLEKSLFRRVSLSQACLDLVSENDYAAIYVAPSRLANWAVAFGEVQPNSIRILNLNDSLTSSFRRQLMLSTLPFFSRGQRLRQFSRGARTSYMPIVERSILRPFDIVLVQTESDCRAIGADCGESYQQKVVVAPNGAKSELFRVPYTGSDTQRLLHLGSTAGVRGQILVAFVDRVFTKVRKLNPSITLNVTGNVRPELASTLEGFEGVKCTGFVERLEDAFSDVSMSVAPLYMTYGLINKVLDSMASGVPCLGVMAFNGIANFENGVHGFESSDLDGCVDILHCALNDSDKLRQVSHNARNLVRADFSWNGTVSTIKAAVETAIAKRARTSALSV